MKLGAYALGAAGPLAMGSAWRIEFYSYSHEYASNNTAHAGLHTAEGLHTGAKKYAIGAGLPTADPRLHSVYSTGNPPPLTQLYSIYIYIDLFIYLYIYRYTRTYLIHTQQTEGF